MSLSERALKVLLIPFVGLLSVDAMICEFRRMLAELHCIILAVVPSRSSGEIDLKLRSGVPFKGAGATNFTIHPCCNILAIVTINIRSSFLSIVPG